MYLKQSSLTQLTYHHHYIERKIESTVIWHWIQNLIKGGNGHFGHCFARGSGRIKFRLPAMGTDPKPLPQH